MYTVQLILKLHKQITVYILNYLNIYMCVCICVNPIHIKYTYMIGTFTIAVVY